ncbi:MAG: hypothetical protein OES26_20060 [Gammaproteobacteria bacterium]|nr:hypothetical protein [Gammaproteobacteria bacterium]
MRGSNGLALLEVSELPTHVRHVGRMEQREIRRYNIEVRHAFFAGYRRLL